MARRPDTPCSGCGKLLFRGRGSLPPGQMMCRPCRTERFGKTREATCAHCSGAFRSVRHTGRWTETCSLSCAQQRRLRVQGIPPGGDPEKRRAKSRAKNHRRRENRRSEYLRVTPEYERTLRGKARRCPLCEVRMTGEPYQPTSKELDHIVPLNVGGTHTIGNVRIICRACNRARPSDGSDYAGPVTLWAQGA